ncbi:MAG: thiamine pyrophosphate-dependent enzyme [Longimicrobiales bacterium]
MLTMDELLAPLADHRTDEVVVTTMSAVRPWGLRSDHDLDFASADSAMGHAADLALGIALARPERRVVCLNGDGSMLMSLGTLVTVVASGATNLSLVIVENGGYEITGNQPVPGAPRTDLAALARAAGFAHAQRFDDAAAWRAAVPALLGGPGPSFATVAVHAGQEGPISRTEGEPARYLRSSLAEWSAAFRAALGEADPQASAGR